MKIKLKHLLPYLEYDLQITYTQYGSLGTNYGETILESLSSECATFKHCSDYYFVSCDDDDDLLEIKPHLRPLSDLTEEIEHNGEKFVPIDWLEEKYYTLSLHKECERLLEEDGYKWINHMSHLLVIHLFEWHFDIFGLIPDLAIDINTLK